LRRTDRSWLSNNNECDIECKGKIAQQGASGGLVLSAAMLAAVTATAATPEVIVLVRASTAGCKVNPGLCVNEANIWLAEFVASEVLPAGLVAGGAAKLTAEQLSDVRALRELQKQTGKQVSSEALSVVLGGSAGAGGSCNVLDEVVNPNVVKQLTPTGCGAACGEILLNDRGIFTTQVELGAELPPYEYLGKQAE